VSMLWCVPAFPLAGFLVLAIFGARFPRALTAAVGAGTVALSLAAAAWVSALFASAPPAGHSFTLVLWQWLNVAGFAPNVSFTLDALSAVMILVVTGVGFLIHLYSTRFMIDDEGYSRFFAYMNLFVASMLILALASSLFLLYLGWEGVGLCSFLLIGFWYDDPENAKAARKAFVVTRIGDISLIIGLFLIASTLGTLDIQELGRRATASWPVGSTLAIASAALILGGAVGKSAQLPLQTWLPDAMAGPTPVSALIHAATMVTAGVYLIARTNALFLLAPAVQLAVAIVGAAGILVAGFSAVTQRNIKRILAYSTMSQLGYMFLALGVGAWSGAIFHLVTHAFFKSLLFLGAGVVILALNHEHDIFAMGGMAKKSPYTFWTFLIGAFALAALPPTTAGLSSKDLILSQAWQEGGVGRVFWALGIAGAFLTSLYIFRLIFIVFGGNPRDTAAAGKPRAAEVHAHAAGKDHRQAGALMGLPLLLLALLCLVGGFLSFPSLMGGKPYLINFLQTILPMGTQAAEGSSASTEWILTLCAFAASVLGIPAAWVVSRRNLRAEAAAAGVPVAAGTARAVTRPRPSLARFLEVGWGFDWLYDRAIVRPFMWIARINARDVVDRLADGVGGLSMLLSRAFRWTQNGKVRWYAAGLAAGAVLIAAAVVLL
jgi:NADH-quinone oxidoreductase subunit L